MEGASALPCDCYLISLSVTVAGLVSCVKALACGMWVLCCGVMSGSLPSEGWGLKCTVQSSVGKGICCISHRT